MKWFKNLFKASVVRKEIENVRIHVVHQYRSVPIYSMSWMETVYVDDKMLITKVRESHTAMAMGKQYTHDSYSSLASEIDRMLAR